MYYSSGNYEAFARPRKPDGVDGKSAWFVGSGLASLAGAAFLIRDGQMPGERITILERIDVPGGALDGLEKPDKGFVIRGGREMENHFECLWDLFRSIPSLEVEGASVLDEFYWLNKDDPNFSLQRATIEQGKPAPDLGKFTLSKAAQKDMLKVFMATREEMENKRINEVFGPDFLKSNFWLFWRTMFAFEEWHSALEMKLYLHRFIHHIGGLADFSALKFTRFNQYESLVLPLVKWLKDQGVVFQYCTEVTDVDFDIDATNGRKQATRIHWNRDGQPGEHEGGGVVERVADPRAAAEGALDEQRQHLQRALADQQHDQAGDEQRERLQERLDDPAKHWKFSMGDIAVRKQWGDYRRAYDTLLGATHTPWAPWTIVPANSKTHRNLMIATVLRAVLQGLPLRYPTGDAALEHFTVE